MADRGVHRTEEWLAKALSRTPQVFDPIKARADKLAMRATKPKMNKWETDYAQLLEYSKREGIIGWYKFEGMKLWLGEGAWYTPDFAVFSTIGDPKSLQFHEVKGFWREAAKVRIKVARSMYPFMFRCMRKVNGAWVEEQL